MLRGSERDTRMIQRVLSRIPRGYALGVILPFVLISLYSLFVQSPQYESHASIMVQTADPMASSLPSLEFGLLDLGGSNEKQDAALITSFIESRRLFDTLNDNHKLVDHWRDRSVDWWSRLPSVADQDEKLNYYHGMVTVKASPETGILQLTVRAYNGEFAQQVLADIVRRTEAFINKVSNDLARTQVEFAEGELVRAHERVKEAANNLITFQGQSDTLSPQAEAEASLQILGALQARKTGLETELSTLRTYLQEDAPDVVATRNRIQATEEQIERERKRQTGTTNSGLNRLLADYKEAELSAELSADLYKVGLQTLETARLEASRKGKFLVQIDPPNLPDEPRFPDSGRDVMLAALALNILYFLVTLIGAAVREHSD